MSKSWKSSASTFREYRSAQSTSQGVGSVGHLAIEMLKILTGADVVHVPYRGEAPALTDLIAGQMHAQFVTMTSATPLAKQGQLRPLAVSMRSRSKSLPEIPALGEVVPGYEMDGIAGLAGPRNVPADIVAKINNEIRASLARPMIQAKYDE